MNFPSGSILLSYGTLTNQEIDVGVVPLTRLWISFKFHQFFFYLHFCVCVCTLYVCVWFYQVFVTFRNFVITTMIKIQRCPITQRNTVLLYLYGHTQPASLAPGNHWCILHLCSCAILRIVCSLLSLAFWTPLKVLEISSHCWICSFSCWLLCCCVQYHRMLFRSPVEGHLGCCHFLAITNRAALNIYI